MKFFSDHPWLITLAASELFFIIVRSRDITVLFKKTTQRTEQEEKSVERGLLRAILGELLLFVPASNALGLLLLPLIRGKFDSAFSSPDTSLSVYALVGLVSYGFPFAAVRKIVTNVALNTLKEFANLQNYDAASNTPGNLPAPLDEPGKEGSN